MSTARGRGIEGADLLDLVVHAPVGPTDCAVATAGPVFKVLEGSGALQAFSSFIPSGKVFSESVVGDAGPVHGLIGNGAAIAGAGLVT